MGKRTELRYRAFGIIPLVFHRIVVDDMTEWDDVNEENFRRVIKEIDREWTTDPDVSDIDSSKWLLTFDDGHSSDFEVAFPILLEANVRATFFPVINFIGKSKYLSWEQIKEMQKYGMSFGSHSLSHQYLSRIAIKDAIKELQDSKNKLQDKLGVEIKSFSFPYGDWNMKLYDEALKIGYSDIYISKHGLINDGMFPLPRNSINSSMDWSTIRKIMYPNIIIRYKWSIEDNVKSLIKNLIGFDKYRELRTKLFKKTSWRKL